MGIMVSPPVLGSALGLKDAIYNERGNLTSALGSAPLLHPHNCAQSIGSAKGCTSSTVQPPPFLSSHTPSHKHVPLLPSALTCTDPHPHAACARMLPPSGPTKSCATQPCQPSQPCPSACGLAAWQYVLPPGGSASGSPPPPAGKPVCCWPRPTRQLWSSAPGAAATPIRGPRRL